MKKRSTKSEKGVKVGLEMSGVKKRRSIKKAKQIIANRPFHNEEGKVFVHKNKQGEHYYSFQYIKTDELITRTSDVDSAFEYCGKLNRSRH